VSRKIKNRLAGEQGFTLIELLIVMIILGILVVVAAPSYLGFRVKAEKAAAQSNVRSAITAAGVYYNDANPATGGNGTYTGITRLKLQGEAPGISPHVRAGASGVKFCIQDSEGAAGYYYEGGTGGTASLIFGLCAVAYAVA
jgi:type IV pilus assembly protein PilA